MLFDKITQIIPTIQGEGPKLGVPSLLIRFKQCNLICPFCDTQWTNRSRAIEYNHHSIEYILDDYPKISNIMITGGEPFLYINEIVILLKSIADVFDQIKTIEIETNGTKINSELIKKLYLEIPISRFKITFNISPKLGPECYVKPETPLSINDRYYNNMKILTDTITGTYIDYVFKIVYSKEWEDHIQEFIDRIIVFQEPKPKVYLMPITPDLRNYGPEAEEDFLRDFRESCIQTIEKCMQWGFIFSPREHVWIYMDKKDEQIEVFKQTDEGDKWLKQ